MDLGLRDMVAWVHGASAGLGRATAESLAREGALVAVSSRDAGSLDAAAAAIAESTGGRCLGVPYDVRDAAALRPAHERVVAELGPVDVLVVNAGGPPAGGFDSFGDDELYDAFALTTTSAWRLSQAVVPSMRDRGRGCIVFITSTSTKEILPNLLLSNIMRPAVVGLAKTMSKELGPHGIRVVCVAPGAIDTARRRSLDERAARAARRPIEEVRAARAAAIPVGRYGRADEFGDVVAFVASERASYLTGVTVAVDGGALDGLLS